MAALRRGRPTCIRTAFSATAPGAGLRKRQRTARRRPQVGHRRSLMDFAESIWREFLDCYEGDSEDVPSRPSHTESGSPGHVPGEDSFPSEDADPALRAASWAPAALGTSGSTDVDMPESEAQPPREDGARGTLAEPDGGRPPPGRAKGLRPPPRLGAERDKAPRLLLSKRKLELFLAEPEKTKRRK